MGTLLNDNFSRVSGSLGPNWSQLTGGFSVNNGAQGTSNTVFNLAKYLSPFALNQQMFFTLGPSLTDGDQNGVAFRIVDHGNGTYDYYCLYATSTGIILNKVTGASNSVAGTVTNIITVSESMSASDNLTIEVVGPNITVFKNGTNNGATINLTDSSLSGTLCGIWNNFTGAGPVDKIASWNGINFLPPTGTQLNVVCDGDSHTFGQEITTPWPSSMVFNLPNNVNNFGVDGQKLSDMITYAPTYLDPFIVPGITNICIVWVGTNDLGNGVTPATLFSNLTTYCIARRTAGWKVITALLSSVNGIDNQVQAFNNLLIANPTIADGIAILPQTMTGPGAYNNSSLISSSGHPTQLAATSVLAPAFSAEIKSFLPANYSAPIELHGLYNLSNIDGPDNRNGSNSSIIANAGSSIVATTTSVKGRYDINTILNNPG